MTAPAPEFTGLVTGGRLPARVSAQIAAVIRAAEGKRVTVTVREQKRNRSVSANAYLWGVVYPPIVAAFREHGNAVDAEDVHLFCKQNVGKLRKVLVTPDGEVLHAVGSTRTLTVAEFSDYIEAVRAWAASTLDVLIPGPSEEDATKGSTRKGEGERACS